MHDSLRFLRFYLRWASIAALLLILPATHAAGLNDTGITTCSDADSNGLACPVAGFPGQDAEFGTNGFDFTKLDAAGNALPASATDHTCVRDNVTGLIWQVKLSDSTYTFDETAGYVTSVNSTGLCGFNDWRMPNPKELMGIADHSRYSPAIDTDYFPNTPSSWFWSGSPSAGSADYAWDVGFYYGYANDDYRDYALLVRLVRGGQSFDTFADNNDGTVSQTNTGLMWAKCSEGQSGTNCTGDAKTMNWSAALTAANNSNLGGYNDWRLPNFKELQALVDYSRYSPAIDTSYFPNTPSSWFWSGSPLAGSADGAWFVYFSYGGAYDYDRGYALLVRLVRGGQSFDPFALTVAKTGDGAGAVTSVPAGIDCGATCTADFDRGSSVMLTAISGGGSRFDGWSGDCTGTSILCTVSLNKSKVVNATFTEVPTAFSLSINKVGSGTVTSAPAGISCGSGSGCTASFANGSAVTLTAKPTSGYLFSGWTGGGCSGTDACTVNMTAAQNVTATFTAVFALTVSKPSNGTVTSSDGSINCGGSCSASLSTRTSVTLTATPATGYLFNGWSGACSGTSATCVIEMSAAKTVSAAFVAIPAIYSLTVNRTGNGMIASEPGGINCGTGADCTASFLNSTAITLTATPASGYSFGGWSGGGCSGIAACSLTLSANTTVSATFIVGAPVTYQLTVSTTGNGSVSSAPAGINCGSDCSEDLVSGTAVTLTATPAVGATFTGWSGACSNKTGTCLVSMTAAQTVTATFAAAPVPTYKLSVTTTGSGTVSSNPAGITCGSDCTETYASGKLVTLTAAPNTGATFVSWAGCTPVAANSLQCTVKMSKAQTVTATFAAIPPTSGNLTVKTVGNGNVTSDPAAINCGSGTLCTASFDSGTAVILTATPATGETFKNWNGCSAASSKPLQCRVTLTGSTTVTATFSTNTTPVADVRVMAIVITPASPAANSSFSAAITVKNLGNTAMNGGYLDVWADQPTAQICTAAGDEWDEIGELLAGESKTLTVKLRATEKGMKLLRIFVDSRCEAIELNEQNNQSAKRYTVK